MKALIITDLHGHRSLLGNIDKAIKKHGAKYLLCCGDLTSSTSDNSIFLLELEKIITKNKVRFLSICGNSDSENIREYLIEKNWHLDDETVEEQTLVGSDFGHEDEFVTKNVSGKLLFTHVPPRYLVLDKQLKSCPLIHFSGHRHNIESDRKFTSTRLVQIKSAQLGRGVILQFPNLNIKFIDLN